MRILNLTIFILIIAACSQNSELRGLESTLVHGPLCSVDSYEKIDACINPNHPPAPSIKKELTTPFVNLEFPSGASTTSTKIFGFPSFNEAQKPDATKKISYPYARPTLDGRVLMFTPKYPSPPPLNQYPPALMIFHPQTLGADLQGKNKQVITAPQFIHPIVFNNPLPGKSAMGDESYNNHNTLKAPNVFHMDICHESEKVNEIKNVPRVCSATKAGEKISGDCYDVTLVMKLEDPAKPQWYELRSVPVTIFVENAKLDTAKIYLYPRLPITDDLPPVEYVSEPQKWADEVGVSSLKQMAQKCYESSEEDLTNDPKLIYCKFVLSQKWSEAGFLFHIPNRNMNFSKGQYFLQPGGAQNSGGGKPNFFEPSISGDGKLILVNAGLGKGMFYSFNKDGSCDASAWKKFEPISKMPIDPDIYENYDLARKDVYFRDNENKIILPGEVIEGGYLWIDRKVRNLFFATMNASRDHYVNLFQRNAVYDNIAGKMVTVLGSWTQHKIITLDNAVNFTDFASNRYPPAFLYIYENDYVQAQGKASTMLFSPEHFLNYYDALMPQSPFDIVWLLSSNTHRTGEVIFDEYIKPNPLVIAHMNALVVRSEEDDGAYGIWLPKDGFWPQNVWNANHNISIPLVSNIDLQTTIDTSRNFQYTETPLLQNSATGSFAHHPDSLVIPDSLKLRGGARIEPVGLGGVVGKGVYLDGINDFISFKILNHEKVTANDLTDHFISIWLDSRELTNELSKRLFTYPDGSWISISTQEIKLFNSLNQARYSIDIKNHDLTPGKYFHFAIKIISKELTPKLYPDPGYEVSEIIAKEKVREITFFINGNPVIKPALNSEKYYKEITNNILPYLIVPFHKKSSTPPKAPFSFSLKSGRSNEFTIGANADDGIINQSFKGWVDEFRLYKINNKHRLSDEDICNLAFGSLLKVTSSDLTNQNNPIIEQYASLAQKTKLFDWAQIYSKTPKICEQLKLESHNGGLQFANQSNRTICSSNTHRFKTSLINERCLRAEELDIYNKPIIAGSPRPDFSEVPFCLSCHHDDSLVKGLNKEALVAGSVAREADPRRQPSDHPFSLSGCLPTQEPLFDKSGPQPRCPSQSTLLDYIFDFHPKLSP